MIRRICFGASSELTNPNLFAFLICRTRFNRRRRRLQPFIETMQTKVAELLKKEREEMEAYVNMTTFSASNLEKYSSRSSDYLMKLPSIWTSSDYTEKQKLQFSIFPQGIYYSKKIDQPRTLKN